MGVFWEVFKFEFVVEALVHDVLAGLGAAVEFVGLVGEGTGGVGLGAVAFGVGGEFVGSAT